MATGCLQGHAERLKQWVSTGLGLLILAIILHFTDGKHPIYSFEIHALSIYVSGFEKIGKSWKTRYQNIFYNLCIVSLMLVFSLVLRNCRKKIKRLWNTFKLKSKTLGYIVMLTPDLTAIPINKQLYSFSYVCFTAGAAGILFSAFYMLVNTSYYYLQHCTL